MDNSHFSTPASEEFSSKENFTFWKNMVLIGTFFIVTPITLAVSLFSLLSLQNNNLTNKPDNTSRVASSTFSGVQVYASLPATFPSVSGEVGASDARFLIVRNYLASYNSPLVPHSDKLVVAADKHNLDYRLLPAIAQQESNLCKIIPPDSHNCWGWGIHSQGSLGFDSYDEAIETVANGLKTQYVDKGLVSVSEIMSKYNPNTPDGAWGKAVEMFMSEMEQI